MVFSFSITTIISITLLISSMILLFLGIIFLINDVTIFIEWSIINLNNSNIIITIIFYWISLIFIGLNIQGVSNGRLQRLGGDSSHENKQNV